MGTITLEKLIQDNQKYCRKFLYLALLISALALFLLISPILNIKDIHPRFDEIRFMWHHMALASLVPLCMGWWAYAKRRRTFLDYVKASANLEQALRNHDRLFVQRTVDDVQVLARSNRLIQEAIKIHQSDIDNHLTQLAKDELLKQLEKDFNRFIHQCDEKLAELKNHTSLMRARNHVRASLALLVTRRMEISQQWEQAYENFSWWNKLMYGGSKPDFSKLDEITHGLQRMDLTLVQKHEMDIQHLNNHFEVIKVQAFNRIYTAKSLADKFVNECANQKDTDTELLKTALWFSALSLPISVWSDVSRAGDVYDVLRQVNGNFAGMSNIEIWWETLFLSPESLAGLTSLTKGAYFEQLVAADMGGALHEHFNHPDTDIIIDGVAFQIKATDSSSYINSVSDEIPIIATSEVALQTGAIDSGYSNEDLVGTVSLAFGGTVIDINDSAVDAILSGLGGIGLLATARGINHAADKHKNGGDAVEALFEGVGVAILGTASALVGTAEIAYKIITSRPSKFVGRVLERNLKKLDEKLFPIKTQN
jgi:hypothetical protein